MDIYAQIATKIIEQQETIIGPIAVEQAESVQGLLLDWGNHQVTVEGDGSKVIDNLVGQYKVLFGQISVEVCRDAAESLIGQLSPEQLPETLK